jgi:hypothetical protein
VATPLASLDTADSNTTPDAVAGAVTVTIGGVKSGGGAALFTTTGSGVEVVTVPAAS